MKWIPLLATAATLAIAAVASAQDRGGRGGDRGGDRGDRPSRGGDRPSGSRADRNDDRAHAARSDRHDPSRDERRAAPSNDRAGRDYDPDRSGAGGRHSPFDYAGRGNPDPRGSRTGGRAEPSPDGRGADRGGFREDARPHEIARIGSPAREYRTTPWHYDGRGRVEATRFGAPPTRAALGIDVRSGGPRGGTTVAVGGVFGGLRVGYVSYSGGGYGGYPRDGYRYGYGAPAGFGYPYYAYDPYAPDVVVVASPWYRYSYLPPYIDHTRVIVDRGYPSRWDWNDWSVYDYDRDRDDAAARDAIDDLQDAFEKRSDRIADRLVPLQGDVAIYNGGRYDYSLNPDDFQKMFLDGIDQSKTIRYEIQEVRRRDDQIRIRARHTYEDSWGNEQSVVHQITLRRERGGDYVVREFGSE